MSKKNLQITLEDEEIKNNVEEKNVKTKFIFSFQIFDEFGGMDSIIKEEAEALNKDEAKKIAEENLKNKIRKNWKYKLLEI